MKFSFSRQTLSKLSGFTLVEVMVVIAIIGIFAAIGMASLGDSKDLAKATKAQSELENIHAAMELLYSDTGKYPTGNTHYCPPLDADDNEVALSLSKAGLVATDGSFTGWNGPYINSTIDPWGRPYYMDEDYHCTAGAIGCDGVADAGTNSSVIVSCGKNGALSAGACAYDDDNIVHVFCRNP